MIVALVGGVVLVICGAVCSFLAWQSYCAGVRRQVFVIEPIPPSSAASTAAGSDDNTEGAGFPDLGTLVVGQQVLLTDEQVEQFRAQGNVSPGGSIRMVIPPGRVRVMLDLREEDLAERRD